MRKEVLLAIVSVFAVAILSSTAILHSQGQKDSNRRIEAATPVQEGVMSDKQREHSRLYKDYKGNGKLRDLLNRPDNQKSNELTITVMPGPAELLLAGKVSLPNEFLNGLAEQADVVVIGSVAKKNSQVTEEGNFVFTDYDVSVEDVLKDKLGRIQAKGSIEVTRPGGKILLDGHVVTVRDRRFAPMTAGGRYLLFLDYITSTGAYQSINEYGGFELVNKKRVEPLTETVDAIRIHTDVAAFIDDVRMAIAVTYNGKRGGLDD